MNQLSLDEMKTIIGGIMSPPDSICSIQCGDGSIGSHDCGPGIACTAATWENAIYCSNNEYPYCPCDGHDIPNT